MKRRSSSTLGLLFPGKNRGFFTGLLMLMLIMLVNGLLLTACSSPASMTTIPADTSITEPITTETAAPTAAVGDLIRFGNLDWRVLEVSDGKALLLSDRILSKQSFNAAHIMVAWDESDIRQYLNGKFYNDTFSEAEKGQITETLVKNAWNPWFPESNSSFTWYSMPKGLDVTDKVFLLSIDEVVQYFGDSGDLEKWAGGVTIMNDDFNEARVAQTEDGNPAWWWLRSPGLHYAACGTSFNNAACVAAHGGLALEGNMVNSEYGGVRPALWVSLESAD